MNNRKSTRRMGLQSSLLMLLAGMSTALVVVDAQNMLQSALKKFRITHPQHHTVASKHLCVEYQLQDDPSVPKHIAYRLWIG
jgi:hypothetical protein